MPGARKLGRASDHRKSMLRGMVTYLLENGRIETTVTRAKEVRAMAEKMITIAKDNTLHSRRQVLAYVTKEDVVKKLFDEIAPKYKDVNGGYCRIIKTGARRGDAADRPIRGKGHRLRLHGGSHRRYPGGNRLLPISRLQLYAG